MCTYVAASGTSSPHKNQLIRTAISGTVLAIWELNSCLEKAYAKCVIRERQCPLRSFLLLTRNSRFNDPVVTICKSTIQLIRRLLKLKGQYTGFSSSEFSPLKPRSQTLIFFSNSVSNCVDISNFFDISFPSLKLC
jgi:hypothetical protein